VVAFTHLFHATPSWKMGSHNNNNGGCALDKIAQCPPLNTQDGHQQCPKLKYAKMTENILCKKP